MGYQRRVHGIRNRTRNKTITTNKLKKMSSFLSSLLCLLLVSTLTNAAPSRCSVGVSSKWQQLLDQREQHQVQQLPMRGQAHLTNLQYRLGELIAMITLKREDFSQDMHGESYIYMDAYHASSSYEAIMPEEALNEIEEWDLRVAVAYDVFQRIALVLEVVKTDLETYDEGTNGVKNLWCIVELHVEEVLVSLFTEMEIKGSSSPTLSMSALPPSLRCETESVRRNHRDFIILRQVLHAASFFSVSLGQA